MILNLSSCNKKPEGTRPKYERIVSYAGEYTWMAVEWINRDYWDKNNGTTRILGRVSYNYFTANPVDTFNARIDSSKVNDQSYWSQYRSFKPGGRYKDNPGNWAGIYCEGLVYNAAIDAGYLIDPICKISIYSWLNEGTVIAWNSVRAGDLILMDLDSTSPGYEHIGIIRDKDIADSTNDNILSAMGLYGYPFDYAAGYWNHTIQNYNYRLQSEPPEDRPSSGYKVYKVTYLRLTE